MKKLKSFLIGVLLLATFTCAGYVLAATTSTVNKHYSKEFPFESRTITTTANADRSGWVKCYDNFSIEVNGITADTVKVFATNKPGAGASDGYQVYTTISADGLYTLDTPFTYIDVRRVGAADGTHTIYLNLQ